MKTQSPALFAILTACSFAGSTAQALDRIVHHFVPDAEGSSQESNLNSLTWDGTRLYGLSDLGGPLGAQGMAFSLNADGSDFRVIRLFDGSSNPGLRPLGGVSISGGKLFGAITAGATLQTGGVFSMNPDGSAFQILHSLSTLEGRIPAGPVAVDGCD